MELPFISKYQPVFLKDFEMKSEMNTLLETLIKMDTLNILFVGNTGSGKTSLINSLVKEYYEYLSIPDENILYINNLKEQGIQYYRNEVKTFCQTPSSVSNKKKFIILDDLDFINEQSQQVFRNCMDKWGHNVHFLCSCVNVQKVIESLQSRMTIIKIKPPTMSDLQKILLKITQIENIIISPEACEFILNISNNSIRILVNYLEKLKLLEEEITIELAMDICTNISFHLFEKYIDYCSNNELQNAIITLKSILNNGFSVMDVLDNFFLFIKYTRKLNETTKYDITKLICKYIIIFHDIHEDDIEMGLFTNNLIILFSNSIINVKPNI